MTDSNANKAAEMGHYPFGESWYNASNDKLLFTTYERDAESGNDYASARYDINRLGRFASPDAVSGSTKSPQSLNRYAYVRNDPINLSDPSGLCPSWAPFIASGRIICGSSGINLQWEVDFVLGQGYGGPGCASTGECGLSSPLADPYNPIYQGGSSSPVTTPSNQSDFQITVYCSEGMGGPSDSICSLASWSQRFAIDGNQPAFLNDQARLRYFAAQYSQATDRFLGQSAIMGGIVLLNGGVAAGVDSLLTPAADEGLNIVLGMEAYGLRQTAEEVGGTVLLDDPNWKETFLSAVANPDTNFTISLDGVSGDSVYSQVMGAAQRGLASGGGNFDWEMGQLYQAGRLGEVTFIRGGVAVPNPF